MRIITGSAKVAFGFGLGVAAAGMLKDILPAFRGLGRPILKATVKSALILAHDSRFKVAEMRETLADITAEAQAEFEQERSEVVADQPVPRAAKQQAGIM